MWNLFQMRYEESNQLKNASSFAHFEGRFESCSGLMTNLKVSVLLDTGALCATYISKTKFEQLKVLGIVTEEMVIYQKSSVGLADNTTSVLSDDTAQVMEW
jgi:hypothetical protein